MAKLRTRKEKLLWIMLQSRKSQIKDNLELIRKLRLRLEVLWFQGHCNTKTLDETLEMGPRHYLEYCTDQMQYPSEFEEHLNQINESKD